MSGFFRSAEKKNKSGFSLIELMVVVGIIGILAALAIPKFSEFQAKARQSEAKTNLNYISTLAEAFYTDDNTYVVTQRNAAMTAATPTAVAFNANCPTAATTQLGVLGFNPTPCNKLSYSYAYMGAPTTFTSTATETTSRVFMCAGNAAGDVWTINELRNLVQTMKGGC